MLESLTARLKLGESLSPEQVRQAVAALVAEEPGVELKADFLSALAQKGETPEEIGAFAAELRDKSLAPPLDERTRQGDILDVCGTGGDHQNTINISTAVALLAAAAGVTVAKHGNRAITSKSGSADVLEALGIPVTLTPEEAAASLRDQGFAFLFAPHYHPAFKHIVPARKRCAERGQRTIFNFLGPLLNPARPTAQLIGVPRPELCEPMARVLQGLGIRRGMVVCGQLQPDNGPDAPPPFLDEWSPSGENTVAEFYQDRGFHVDTVDARDFPVRPCTPEDLAGGDAASNAAILRAVLGGEDRGPRRDAVLLNAAAALFVAGRCASMGEGWDLAGEVIDDGRARLKLAELAQR